MNKVWVLTESYNDYDQHGNYFIKVWKNKPTEKELRDVGVENNIEHVLNGGGRVNYEDQWYYLTEEQV